jgi:hypothetical protein
MITDGRLSAFKMRAFKMRRVCIRRRLNGDFYADKCRF